MTDEPRMTVNDFVDELVRERGGRERFNAVQLRLCATIALALRDPQKIEPSVVRDLVAMLPPLTKPTAPTVQKLEIEFVGEPDAVERALRERIDELERDLVRARDLPVIERGVSDQRAAEQQRVRPSQSQGEPFYEQRKVVPLHPLGSVEAMCAGLMASGTPGSGYGPGIGVGGEYSLPRDPNDKRRYE
jgi:hypothetical protein